MERSAVRARLFLLSLAVRSRALWISRTTQSGHGVERSAARARDFLLSLAAHSRALWISRTTQSGHGVERSAVRASDFLPSLAAHSRALWISSTTPKTGAVWSAPPQEPACSFFVCRRTAAPFGFPEPRKTGTVWSAPPQEPVSSFFPWRCAAAPFGFPEPRKTGTVWSALPQEPVSSFLPWRRTAAPFALFKQIAKTPRGYHELNMPNSVVYDDAVYHQGAPSFLTRRLNPHNGGTHIGMYLAWIILSRLESFQLRQTAASPVEEVRGKQMTGRDFLFAHCDGRLTSDALNKEAQAFTEFYYEDQYLHDYHDILVKKATGTYTVVDSWANYERLAVVMDRRLRDYRGRSPQMEPLAAS